jgi:hypothetical protein
MEHVDYLPRKSMMKIEEMELNVEIFHPMLVLNDQMKSDELVAAVVVVVVVVAVLVHSECKIERNKRNFF